MGQNEATAYKPINFIILRLKKACFLEKMDGAPIPTIPVWTKAEARNGKMDSEGRKLERVELENTHWKLYAGKEILAAEQKRELKITTDGDI